MSVVLLTTVLATSLLVGRGGTADAPLVADHLTRQAASKGSVRVIVRLGTPFTPEGRMASRAHVQSQRQAIAGTQATVRGSLRGVGHRVARDFNGRLPLMAIEAGPDALRMLRSMRGTIVQVQEDRQSPPALSQSVPLIRVSPTVWNAGFDGTGQIVAILDTGVQKDHPFFAAGGGKVVAEACFSSNFPAEGATSVCPGGLEQSFVAGAGEPCSIEGCDHGTHVAGIAAGDGRGVAGAPPGGVARGAKIIAIQVFSNVSGPQCGGFSPCLLSFDSDQIAALDWLHSQRLAFAGHRIASANMSLGGGETDTPCPGDLLESAIVQLRTPNAGDPTDPGVATVIASGNDGFTDAMNFPACNPTAIAVGSTTKSDTISSFSNLGSPAVFPNLVVAPGGSGSSAIVSSLPPQFFPFVEFGGLIGTSMSTPHVAGAFAVLRQIAPTLEVGDVLTTLQATGKPITDKRPFCFGCFDGNATVRRIDLLAAATQLAPPNLVVQTLTVPAPAAGIPGGNISTSTSIRNTGLGPVGASNLGLYLSTDNVITPSDVLLGTIAFGALNGGQTSGVVARSVRIPGGTTPGAYFIGAIADADGQIDETADGDNTKSAAVTIVLPDLMLSTVTATPLATAPGLNVSIAQTVKNVAATPAHAPASTSRVFLSADEVFGGDVDLGTVAVPAINAGGSASVTRSVPIPGDTSPGRYWIFAQANAPGGFSELSTANNTARTATSLLVGPDLLVTAASTVTGAAPGMNVSVKYTLKNQGGQAASSFAVGFALVPIGDPSGASDVVLGPQRAGVSLAAGGSGSLTSLVLIPSGTTPGQYRIRVIADAGGAVTEADEANNALLTAGLMNVVRPDLTVPTVTFTPGASLPGGNVSLTQAVRNASPAPGGAPPSQSRLYLTSTNSSISSPVADFGLVGVPMVAGGGTVKVTSRITIPPGTLPGRYFFVAAADAPDAIVEQDETNNLRGSVTQLIVGPDLLLTVAVTATGASPGTNVSVKYTLKNQGGQAASGVSVSFALVPAGDTSGASDIALGPGRTGITLAPGASAALTSLVLVPPTTAVGAYQIRVTADAGGAVAEADETNNARLTAGLLNIVHADLAVQAVTAISTIAATPNATAAGLNMSVTTIVKNLATTVGAAPPTTLRLSLSNDAVLDGSDVVLVDVLLPVLKGGATTTVKRSVQIPAGTAPGLYWIFAQANATNAVIESDSPTQTNDIARTATPIIVGPDLVVTVATAPVLAGPGAPLAVTTTIRNQGGQATNASVVRFVLASASAPDVVLDETRQVPALAPGAVSGPVVTVVTIPGNTALTNGAAPVYVIRVQADADGGTAEADETNNARSTGTFAVKPPDLQIVSIAPPAAAVRGRSDTPTAPAPRAAVTIRNAAGAGPSAPFDVELFVNRDDGTEGARAVGAGDRMFTLPVASIPPGGSIIVRGPVVVPEIVNASIRLAGNYFASARADASGVTRDPVTSDNAGTSAVKIAVLPDMRKLTTANVNISLTPFSACGLSLLNLSGPFDITTQSVGNPSTFGGTVTLTDSGPTGFNQIYKVTGTVQAVDIEGTAGKVLSSFTYTATLRNEFAGNGGGKINGAAPGLNFTGGSISGKASSGGCTFTGSIDVVRSPS